MRQRGSRMGGAVALVVLATLLLTLVPSSGTSAGILDVVTSKKNNQGQWKWAGGNGGNFGGATHSFINGGDRVRWKVPGNQQQWHDVHSWNNNSINISRINPGQSVTKTFNAGGQIKYRCVRHSAIISGQCRGMCGVIHR
jgi:plastocyanin